MAESQQNDPPDNPVDIYMLTKLTPEEETAFTEALDTDDGDNRELSWVKPKLVPWTGSEDGTIDRDVLKMYKEKKAEMGEEFPAFMYFADRESVDGEGLVQVDQEFKMLCIDEAAAEEMTELLKKNGIELEEPWDQYDSWWTTLMDELSDRGVTWGRVPSNGWKSAWCNLDIANMGSDELIEMYEGEVQVVKDADWDPTEFLKKLKELMAKEAAEEGKSDDA